MGHPEGYRLRRVKPRKGGGRHRGVKAAEETRHKKSPEPHLIENMSRSWAARRIVVVEPNNACCSIDIAAVRGRNMTSLSSTKLAQPTFDKQEHLDFAKEYQALSLLVASSRAGHERTFSLCEAEQAVVIRWGNQSIILDERNTFHERFGPPSKQVTARAKSPTGGTASQRPLRESWTSPLLLLTTPQSKPS